MQDRYERGIARNLKDGLLAALIIFPIMYLVVTIAENWESIVDFFNSIF